MTDTKYTAERPLRVASLGAGRQSSAMLLMMLDGAIPVKPDVALFADTGWEPAGVYAWLSKLEQIATDHGLRIERVSAGNLRQDTLDGHGKFNKIPLYAWNKSGRLGMLRRQCTQDYKLAPIYKRIREIINVGKPQPNTVEMYIGISLDEATRMKPSRVKYVKNLYPLVESRLTLFDCIKYLDAYGIGMPAKSACIGCPYHDNKTWRDMKLNRPDDFADAVEFDESIRKMDRLNSEAFVHRSGQPLAEVDLRDETDAGQLVLDGFDAECEGMCGL